MKKKKKEFAKHFLCFFHQIMHITKDRLVPQVGQHFNLLYLVERKTSFLLGSLYKQSWQFLTMGPTRVSNTGTGPCTTFLPEWHSTGYQHKVQDCILY